MAGNFEGFKKFFFNSSILSSDQHWFLFAKSVNDQCFHRILSIFFARSDRNEGWVIEQQALFSSFPKFPALYKNSHLWQSIWHQFLVSTWYYFLFKKFPKTEHFCYTSQVMIEISIDYGALWQVNFPSRLNHFSPTSTLLTADLLAESCWKRFHRSIIVSIVFQILWPALCIIDFYWLVRMQIKSSISLLSGFLPKTCRTETFWILFLYSPKFSKILFSSIRIHFKYGDSIWVSSENAPLTNFLWKKIVYKRELGTNGAQWIIEQILDQLVQYQKLCELFVNLMTRKVHQSI